MALPPIVNAAIIAVITSVVINISKLFDDDNIAANATPADPDTIPHISPITSLQKLDAFSLFFINLTASLAPLTFLVAIELNVLISATVIDIPTISNIIPKAINNKIIIVATILLACSVIPSEKKENAIEIKNANTVTVIIHFQSTNLLFLIGFLLTFLEYFSL